MCVCVLPHFICIRAHLCVWVFVQMRVRMSMEDLGTRHILENMRVHLHPYMRSQKFRGLANIAERSVVCQRIPIIVRMRDSAPDLSTPFPDFSCNYASPPPPFLAGYGCLGMVCVFCLGLLCRSDPRRSRATSEPTRFLSRALPLNCMVAWARCLPQRYSRGLSAFGPLLSGRHLAREVRDAR